LKYRIHAYQLIYRKKKISKADKHNNNESNQLFLLEKLLCWVDVVRGSWYKSRSLEKLAERVSFLNEINNDNILVHKNQGMK